MLIPILAGIGALCMSNPLKRKRRKAKRRNPGKNGYICFYKSKQLEVYADTTIEARDIAVKHFKPRKAYEVTVMLAEKGGEPVIHTAVNPRRKNPTPLRAKKEKPGPSLDRIKFPGDFFSNEREAAKQAFVDKMVKEGRRPYYGKKKADRSPASASWEQAEARAVREAIEAEDKAKFRGHPVSKLNTSKLPAGDYIIADPAYVFPQDVSIPQEGFFEIAGYKCWIGGTRHGDGGYPVFVDKKLAGEFSVDSGMYCILPLKFVEEYAIRAPLFKHPAGHPDYALPEIRVRGLDPKITVKVKAHGGDVNYSNGNVQWGNVLIMTSPS